ncbi:MAG: GDP-mannose 4,6-dehydratase, partial [Planctomycetes bacterium]|nr:GDP-mannose 4,6-dehydratase [Planctomycetota bacterium]
ATDSQQNIQQLRSHPDLTLVAGDLEDGGYLARLFAVYRIDECYNLAAQSFVRYSFDNPVATITANFIGVVNLLEGIRLSSPATRFYQASTSEMFGGLAEEPLSENHSFHPRSPYGTSKLAAYWHTVNLREASGLFAVNGILFNHESPRRGPEFVTQKVVQAAIDYRDFKRAGARGDAPVLKLGNLDAKRDWGHAKDYVRGMWLMLQQDAPDDYVLATGETQSVRTLVELAFRHPEIGTGVHWEGSGTEEVGRDDEGRVILRIDPVHYRPTEVNVLLGDPSKARRVLGWKPEFHFEDLIDDMVRAGVARRAS